MARDGKRKGGDGKAAGTPKGATAAADGRAPNVDNKLARLVAKRVKKLERQLTDAARVERKRLRSLDRAHRRRQLIEAALDELRVGTAPAPALTPAEAIPSAAGAAVPVAEPAPAATRPAPRTTARTPRRAATPKSASARSASASEPKTAVTPKATAPKAGPRRPRRPPDSRD
jgi:hypothetical protein